MTVRGARKLAGACVVATFVALVGSASPVAAETETTTLRDAVNGWASEIGAPGMAAQIVDADGVLADAVTGVDGHGTAVDAGTPFVWGSVSKQFTAATVSGMEREGKIEGSTPVVDLVPQARQMLPDAAVTIDDLVHHTSGLPHDVSVTDDWTQRGSATDAVASVGTPDGTSARGVFRYSSLNYLLLQAVIEQATGGSYADALNREVLEPADATGTITDPDEFTRVITPGHVPFFGSAKPIDVGVDTAGLGYGYLAGSIDDLGRYASWRLTQLQNGESDAPEVPTEQGTQYGDGLFHETIDGQDVWWHSGAVPGYYTYVAMVPSQNKAMVLATNRYGEIEAERVAAVGRNLTTLVLAGTTSELPASSAVTVLGIMAAVVVLLLAGAAWMATRLFRGRTRERSPAGFGVRIAVAVVVGGAVLYGAFVGVPSLVGATLPVMSLWAPDVTLVFWVLLGAVVLATALVVADEVVNYSRLRRR